MNFNIFVLQFLQIIITNFSIKSAIFGDNIQNIWKRMLLGMI